MAQELEEKSGGVIIERVGSRLCLFRGYTDADIPRKESRSERGWWQTYQDPVVGGGTDAPVRTPKPSTDWWNVYREDPEAVQEKAKRDDGSV